MSLQAKIEAVIYASEEPVTLQQLIGLLGQEAQAELDALDSQQAELALEPASEPAGETAGDRDALNAEVLEDDGALEREPEGEAATAGAGNANSSASLRNDNQGSAPAVGNDSGQAELRTPETDAGAADFAAEESSSRSQNVETPGRDLQTHEGEDSTPSANREKRAARERERRLRDYFRSLLDRLVAEYANSDRGLEIREVAGGFRLATKPEYHDAVRGFVKSLKPALKLSLQALETLAVVAYKQPVTAPEISEIRGVESGGVLGTLMTRKLIGTAGRKAVIGRPMLYKTTKEFLVRFGLKDINELPSIEEFEKMAGELTEPLQEEIPMHDESQGTRESVELVSGDGSPVLDELNTKPSAESVGGDADEVAAKHARGAKDGSTEGSRTEPSSGVSNEAADAVADHLEPSRNMHEAQADGVPDSTQDQGDVIDNHEPYTGSDQTGA